MIIAAACKIRINNNEVVLCGVRHGSIFEQLIQMGFSSDDFEIIEQGFVTHEDVFLNRVEALSHAIDCGQICSKLVHGRAFSELISKELW